MQAAADPRHGACLVDTCQGLCVECGATDRVFIETDAGVISRCLRCGDESLLQHRPISCARREVRDR